MKRIEGYEWVTRTNAFQRLKNQLDADGQTEFIEGLKALAIQGKIGNPTDLDRYLEELRSIDWPDLESRI